VLEAGTAYVFRFVWSLEHSRTLTEFSNSRLYLFEASSYLYSFLFINILLFLFKRELNVILKVSFYTFHG
jgi:hypothetical protein